MRSNVTLRLYFIAFLTSLSVFISLNTQASYEASDYFKNPDIVSAKLSPNGKYVAFIRASNEHQQLFLFESETKMESMLLDLSESSEDNTVIRSIAWIDDSSIAAQYSEVKEGVKDLLDTRISNYLLIIKFIDADIPNTEIFKVRTKGWLIDPLPSEPGKFLYAKRGIYSKIYKLSVDQLGKVDQPFNKLAKVDGGQFVKDNEVISTEGYVSHWFLDQDKKPVAALTYIKSPDLALVTFDESGEPTELKAWDYSKVFSTEAVYSGESSRQLLPIALSGEPNTFYCLDFSEDEEKSLYKVNFATGDEQLVYESGSYKIMDIILSSPDNRLVGVQILRDGEIQNVYLDGSAGEEMEPRLGSTIETVIDRSDDGMLALIYTETHSSAGHYYIEDYGVNKSTALGSLYPHLDNQADSLLVNGKVIVEGLEIPYLLSFPSGEQGPYPLVVMPHGGPIGVFDHRYFDLSTQFLVANGYAVLRVNFRGSSGYSTELKEAGKKEWGGLMLEDIYQATLEVIQKAEIDETRVCAFGSSYGGYAATMLTIKHPDTYHCAINNAGVSDLNLYLSSNNINDRQDEWLSEYVGDTLTNYDVLKSISLTAVAKDLERPILITHGDRDEVVDIEHAYRLKLLLDKYEKSYEWKVYPGVGHSHSKNEERIQFFTDVKDFLDSQLTTN